MVAPDAPVVLKVENLNAGKMVQNVSFELHKGEILGFSGLMGAGRTETARALFGADPKQSGKISIMDKQSGQLREVTINTPQDAVKYGIGYLSEDRRRYGVVVQKSVNENTTLAKWKISPMDSSSTKQKRNQSVRNISKNLLPRLRAEISWL